MKKILLIVIFILLLIPIVTSSILDLKQRRENELAQQKILAEEKAKNDAAEKIYLLGEFDPSQRADFSVLPEEYSISGYTMYLRKETLDAFLQMADAATKDGIDLKIASATRNFDYQKDLWNKKWEGYTFVNGKNLSKSVPDELDRFETILEYSAAPGTSRHHWGTDIDINNANPQYFDTKQGEAVYNWMEKNASTYGFCQPYTVKGNDRPNGYDEEKWHWSYVPLSKVFAEDYKKLINDADLKGFDGDEYVTQEDLANNYVLGINKECL